MKRDLYSSRTHYSIRLRRTGPRLSRYATVGLLAAFSCYGFYVLFFSEPKSIFSEQRHLEGDLIGFEENTESSTVEHLDDLLEN